MIKNRFCSPGFNLRIAGKAAAVAFLAIAVAPFATSQQTGQRTFSSASEASTALVSALKADDESGLMKILGPSGKDVISSGDPAEDKTNREQFVQKYKQMHRLVDEPDGTTTLYIGAENWPTPIPLKKKNGAWYFDTAMGKEEILYRRVGRNELSAIQVCNELVDAEKEYYGQPHDGESGNQYAQKFVSGAGKHDGLYWQASAGEAESPIGPMLAAAAEGHAPDSKPEPFDGYYYRILTEEADAGHARSYIVDGKMTRGFAFIAYPAAYRVSGVMTFLVDQDGIVREKDLGPRTGEIAKKLTRYDRDASWRKAD
jgi:hypothetical protein